VTAVSQIPNWYARLLDIVWTLVRKARSIDVLVVYVYGGASFVVEDVASFFDGLLGHRIVMLLHGGSMPEFMAWFPRWSKRVLRRAHATVAPSAFLARAVLPRGSHCRIIPNVIDLHLYPFRYRRALKPRLLWMRSFHPAYNPLGVDPLFTRI
jgi:hypothetical protein